MEILNQFLDNILDLTHAMAIYIVVGLFIAGILKEIIPDDFVSSQLGNNSIWSVIKATILGIPLPVCSCSVVPLAKSLDKEGASKGAVQSFLISTPITGVDSIMATYSLLGAVFTVYRVVTSVIIAIIAGVLQNLLGEKDKTQSQTQKELESEKTLDMPEEACGCSSKQEVKVKKTLSMRIKSVFHYAYMVLFKDIAKALFWGILIGAAFTTFLPKELLQSVFSNSFLTYFLVLVISLPMVASLMMAGMSGGAGFVFLSAGPATNSVTMGVIAQMFGKKSLFIYLGVISVFSIAFGALLDLFWTDINITTMLHMHEEVGVFSLIGSGVLWALIAYFLLLPFFKKEETSCCSEDSEADDYKEEKNMDSSCCSTEKETEKESENKACCSTKPEASKQPMVTGVKAGGSTGGSCCKKPKPKAKLDIVNMSSGPLFSLDQPFNMKESSKNKESNNSCCKHKK